MPRRAAMIPREHVEWLVDWLNDLDTGISSESLAFHAVTGRPLALRYGGETFPADRSDFGRCERMFASAPPELQARMRPTLEEWRGRFMDTPTPAVGSTRRYT